METAQSGQVEETLKAAAVQNASYPVRLEVDYPERSSRWWALGTLLLLIPKMIALIPHLIIIYVLQYVMLLVLVAGQIVVLFTGKYPRALFNFIVGFVRWQTRLTGFIFGLTDKYPPFGFK